MPVDSPRRLLGMGIIGCADIAVRRILPALVTEPSARLVAVASRDPGKAERVATRFGCTGVAGYQELLRRDDIEAVYVPLPPGLHYEWVAKALEAGKHVLVEKPLCTSYGQTVELVEFARERGLVLAENFMFLHHSQHRRVQSMIDSGTIGQLRVFSSSFGVPPLNPDSFRYRPDLGGGALLDVGVYPLRAAQLYIPGDLEVLAACLRVDEATGVEIAGGAMLCTPDGVTVQLDFGFEHSYRSTCSLWGSKGRLTVQRAFTPPEHHRPLVRVEQQDVQTELSLSPDNQVRNALEAFVTAALSGVAGLDSANSMIRQALLLEQVRKVAKVVEPDREDLT